MRWHSWLRHCATSWKVAGSIPDSVIGVFHRHNPSGRTMALWLTQSLTEISTRNISWRVKTADASGRPYYLHVWTVFKCGSLNLQEPSGPVQACRGIALPFTGVHICAPRMFQFCLRLPFSTLVCVMQDLANCQFVKRSVHAVGLRATVV